MTRRITLWVPAMMGCLFCLGILTSCLPGMQNQPRYEPYEESAFFADQASVRPRVPDTVARGQLRLDPHLNTGRIDNQFVQTFPLTTFQETNR